jgi:hypothetical protein
MSELSQDWIQGYLDGYNDYNRLPDKCDEYRNGYQRGVSDSLMDMRVTLKPKPKGAYPKLQAVVEAAKNYVDKDDADTQHSLKDALAALEEEP